MLKRKTTGQQPVVSSASNLPYLCLLHHLNLNADTRWERKRRECLNDLWCWVHNIENALVDPHLKLLACVFVDKGTAVDRILGVLGRQRDRTKNGCLVAERRVIICRTELSRSLCSYAFTRIRSLLGASSFASFVDLVFALVAAIGSL